MKNNNYTPLLERGEPDLYRKNAFRLLGISPHSDARGIKRRLDKIKMMQKVGGQATQENTILPLADIPDFETLREAGQRLTNPEEKLIEEIFWFWPRPNTTIDNDPALIALRKGDTNSAISFWIDKTDNFDDGDIGLHNIAVLYHTLAMDLEIGIQNADNQEEFIKKYTHYWKQALDFWYELIARENFWHELNTRVREYNDHRLTKEVVLNIRNTLPEMLMRINAKLAIQAAEKIDNSSCERHLELMQSSTFDSTVVQKTLRYALNSVTHQIELLCKNVKSNIDKEPEKGIKEVDNLLRQSEPLLVIINQVYGKDDIAKERIHDDLALTALQCLITYGNKTHDWGVCGDLIERFKDKTYGLTVRNKIKDTTEAIKHNIKFAEEEAENNKCWFCKTNDMDKDSSFEVKMFGDVKDRNTGYGEIERTWRHGTFTIPRCMECAKAHKDNLVNKIFNWIWYGAAVGLVIVISSNIQWAGMSFDLLSGAVFSSGICAIAGIIIGSIVSFYKGPSDSIKSLSKKHDHPTIANLLKDGWAFGERPSSD